MEKPCLTCDAGWGCTDGTSCEDTCVELQEWIEREQMDKPINDQTVKADAGKAAISNSPPQIIWDIAEVKGYGDRKYGSPDNWKSVDIKRYIDALLRHTLAFWENPDSVDAESGIPHYKHMACNMAFICAMMRWRHEKRGE